MQFSMAICVMLLRCRAIRHPVFEVMASDRLASFHNGCTTGTSKIARDETGYLLFAPHIGSSVSCCAPPSLSPLQSLCCFV